MNPCDHLALTLDEEAAIGAGAAGSWLSTPTLIDEFMSVVIRQTVVFLSSSLAPHLPLPPPSLPLLFLARPYTCSTTIPSPDGSTGASFPFHLRLKLCLKRDLHE